jgi:hypothetical protein
MAIIDNLQKISDTVWELPTSYKEGMRVPSSRARALSCSRSDQIMCKPRIRGYFSSRDISG